MSDKINIYMEISNSALKDNTCLMLSEDWSTRWHFVNREQNRASPEETDIAVIDRPALMKGIGAQAVVIFLGAVENDSRFFSALEEPNPELLVKVIKRAHSYRDITRQNAGSAYKTPGANDTLESIAQSLSARVHQLIKQSEMRIALVDQMPAGVLGIDDESNVVLLNPKAIEILGVEDTPVWGLSAEALLGSPEAAAFISSDSDGDFALKIKGAEVIMRRAPFVLENNLAGTIVVLWRKEDTSKGKGA
jgi:PAS domain-containing protein